MSRWRVDFDDDEGMWLRSSPTTRALMRHGYAAGGFKNEKTRVRTYTLHRVGSPTETAYPIIFETEDLEQLNAFINLVLPPDTEG